MQPPFIGPSYNLQSRPASVQRTVNMVPVPLEPGNERTAWVLQDVPGLSALSLITDPFAAEVLGLWHFDDAPGSASAAGIGPCGALTRISGEGATTAAQSVFGGGSLYGGPVASGTYDWWRTAAAFPANASSWTWEARYKRAIPDNTVFGSDALGLVSPAEPGGNYIVNLTAITSGANDGKLVLTVNGVQRITSAAGVFMTAAGWIAIAVAVENGSVIRLFVNGVLIGSYTGAIPGLSAGAKLSVGPIAQTPGFSYAEYWMDEARLTAACRYTDTYAVIGLPFTTP